MTDYGRWVTIVTRARCGVSSSRYRQASCRFRYIQRSLLAAAVACAVGACGGSIHTSARSSYTVSSGKPADAQAADLSPGLTRFLGYGLTFAYPSAWHARHYVFPPSPAPFGTSFVYLSPQTMHPPCITRRGTHNTTVICREPVARLQPGSILAFWSIMADPAWSFSRAAGTPLRVGGRPAKLAITSNDSCGIGADKTMDTVIAIPGSNDSWYELVACIGAPNTALRESQVRDLLHSVRFTS